ncbi:acyltransferase family protein [Gynuella sp.]|uniref:acyltransferase family protein n=1 Tax=Gynuella sp. TaxID=2969146 RepID=UPI003D144655
MMTNTPSPNTGSFLSHIHAFRGFAIINVVGAHSWSTLMYLIWGSDILKHMNLLYATTKMAFHGSTLYFAFISGLLFSKVLKNKGWKSFFKNKLMNVMAPYFVLSLFFLTTFWSWYLQSAADKGRPTEFIPALLDGLFFGRVLPHFWYIPVLLVIFLLTPLFQYLLHQPRCKWIIFALIVAPLIISRTTIPAFLSLQTLIYFSGAYIFGMWVGKDYNQTLAVISRYRAWLWCIAIAGSLALTLLVLQHYESNNLTAWDQTLVYLQKTALICLILHYFSKHEAVLPGFLNLLGTYAFAIYFLHLAFTYLVARGLAKLMSQHQDWLTLALSGLLVLTASIALSIAISKIVRLLLGRRSRILIGV